MKKNHISKRHQKSRKLIKRLEIIIDFFKKIWKCIYELYGRIWKHKLFLYVVLLIAGILFCIYLCNDLNTKMESIIISIATGLIASSIIAWYSELKNYELSEMEELLFEIDCFERNVQNLCRRIDGKNASVKTIADSYMKLMDEQFTVAEKYHNNKHITGLIPALGDDEAMKETYLSDMVSSVWESDTYTPEFVEEFHMVIRDSLAIMERQNRMCMSKVKGVIKSSQKMLWF